MRPATVALALVLAAPVAIAQELPSTYTLTLAPEQMRLLALALQERPYREVASVIAEIQRQIDGQKKKSAE